MIIRIILICFLLLAGPRSWAFTAMFYQPQEADRAIPSERWSELFTSLREKGFDTLVIQWSQYGSFLNQEQDKIWLQEVIAQAKQANLRLVLGLSSNPDAFNKIKQSKEELEVFFHKTLSNDRKIFSGLSNQENLSDFLGWYLPLEIDDREWRDQSRQAILIKYLKQEAAFIQGRSSKPIYMSSFFTGNMTPEHYSKFLKHIKSETGIKLWVQDGDGTNKLTKSERALYLNQLNNCESKFVDGMIFEIFRQTQHDQQFAAEPLALSEMSAKLKNRAPCGGDSVFFEMRYLMKLQ